MDKRMKVLNEVFNGMKVNIFFLFFFLKIVYWYLLNILGFNKYDFVWIVGIEIVCMGIFIWR